MAVLTIACQHGNHGNCHRNDNRCECICHRKDSQPLSDAAEEARVRATTFELRWQAHQAVKRFDLKPGLNQATEARDALTKYIQQLNDTNDRGPE